MQKGTLGTSRVKLLWCVYCDGEKDLMKLLLFFLKKCARDAVVLDSNRTWVLWLWWTSYIVRTWSRLHQWCFTERTCTFYQDMTAADLRCPWVRVQISLPRQQWHFFLLFFFYFFIYFSSDYGEMPFINTMSPIYYAQHLVPKCFFLVFTKTIIKNYAFQFIIYPETHYGPFERKT